MLHKRTRDHSTVTADSLGTHKSEVCMLGKKIHNMRMVIDYARILRGGPPSYQISLEFASFNVKVNAGVHLGVSMHWGSFLLKFKA